MKKIIIVLVTLSIVFMSNAQDKEKQGIINVSAQEFKKLISKEVGLLMDVRTTRENTASGIEGAIVIPITDSNFGERVDKLDKNTPVLVYCRSGGRSYKAARLLESKGFKTIYNLSGGFIAWSRL